MSKASEELEQQTQGDVPTADQVAAATADEAAEALQTQRAAVEARVRRDPLRSVFVAAGIGFGIALALRRL